MSKHKKLDRALRRNTLKNIFLTMLVLIPIAYAWIYQAFDVNIYQKEFQAKVIKVGMNSSSKYEIPFQYAYINIPNGGVVYAGVNKGVFVSSGDLVLVQEAARKLSQDKTYIILRVIQEQSIGVE